MGNKETPNQIQSLNSKVYEMFLEKCIHPTQTGARGSRQMSHLEKVWSMSSFIFMGLSKRKLQKIAQICAKNWLLLVSISEVHGKMSLESMKNANGTWF